jgi:hypothetical protein
MAEESFFAIEHIIKQQQDLYAQFIEWFNPLIVTNASRNDVQMYIFSNADEYSAYCDNYAPELKGGSGFYSHGMDRMVVYCQRDADWVKDGQQQIADAEKQYQGKLDTEQARQSFSRWQTSARGQLMAQADRATQAVIRHEGAHQLLFTLGVQHRMQNGRGWVTEGLATFCETEKIGQVNAGRIDELKAALAGAQLISLQELMAMPRCESPLAYAEAWSLTYLLMQPEYRTGFFAYLDGLRNHSVASSGDPVQELCRFLLIEPAGLELLWRTRIAGLVNR